jgi:hypothetical protein
MIPLTGSHWGSNYQKGGYDLINRWSLEIQSKQRRLGSHYLVVIGDPINKKEVRIPLTGCHWRFNKNKGG